MKLTKNPIKKTSPGTDWKFKIDLHESDEFE